MPYLAFNLNNGNEFIFDLLEERLSLGRNPGNEIVIDNNQISSFHAEFARQPGGAYLLTDLKSSNGTYVNDRRVESSELKSGDRIRFGQLEARFRNMYIPGPGREKKGPSLSAEEKRRSAESSGGATSRTDIIPLADKPASGEESIRQRKLFEPEKREHEEAKLELSRLHDELSATEKRAAEARARAAEAEQQFAERQAELQNSQAAKIGEFDAILAAKQVAVEVADGRLRELEARHADLESKSAELAEAERKLADLRNEICRDESKHAELAGLIATLATERSTQEAEIATISAGQARRETELGEQKDALERAVALLTRQREEKEREIAGLAEQGAAQHTLLQTLSKQTAWLEDSVKIRQRRVEAANRYLAGIDSRAAELEAQSAANQAELENTRARVTKAEAVLKSLYNEIQVVVTRKEKLLAKHDEHACFP